MEWFLTPKVELSMTLKVKSSLSTNRLSVLHTGKREQVSYKTIKPTQHTIVNRYLREEMISMEEYVVPFTLNGVTATVTVEAKTGEAAQKKIIKLLKALRKETPQVEFPERV